jgi:hypothetical protein
MFWPHAARRDSIRLRVKSASQSALAAVMMTSQQSSLIAGYCPFSLGYLILGAASMRTNPVRRVTEVISYPGGRSGQAAGISGTQEALPSGRYARTRSISPAARNGAAKSWSPLRIRRLTPPRCRAPAACTASWLMVRPVMASIPPPSLQVLRPRHSPGQRQDAAAGNQVSPGDPRAASFQRCEPRAKHGAGLTGQNADLHVHTDGPERHRAALAA